MMNGKSKEVNTMDEKRENNQLIHHSSLYILHESRVGGTKKVARHSTALGERRYRCYLPVLAGFTRLPMHGTWPTRTMGAI